MKATISWWDLNGSDQTIDSLRAYLHDEGVRPWAEVDGLQLKFWFSDPESNLWGAVMLWDESTYPPENLPPNRATELIGYSPTTRMSAQIDALVTGSTPGDLGSGLIPHLPSEGSNYEQ